LRSKGVRADRCAEVSLGLVANRSHDSNVRRYCDEFTVAKSDRAQ